MPFGARICGYVTCVYQHGKRIVAPAGLFPIAQRFRFLVAIVAIWTSDLILNHLGFLKNPLEPVK